MDNTLQQQYLAAEQAYGDGNFVEAESIASTLLTQLEAASSTDAEEEARLAWRAFVALLLGHIHFHGLNQPEQALVHYHLALQSQPPDTLRDLADQGVERCEAQITATPTEPNPGPEPDPDPLPDPAQAPVDDHDPGLALIQDPFLGSAAVTPSAPAVARPSATPWLDDPAPEPAAIRREANVEANVAERNGASEDACHGTNDENAADVNTGDDNDWHKIAHTVASHSEAVEPAAANTVPAETELEMEHDTEPTPEQTIDLTPWLLRRTIAFNND